MRPTAINIPRNLRALLLGLALVLAPLPGSALPDDREQPIHISADKAVRDEKRGVTIYSGNVQMRQGSMELDADSLTIYHEARDADKIVAEGNPAKMRQRPKLDEGLVHAHANVITYFRHKELIHLRTAARLTRDDGTLVTGDSIDYFIAEELVKAESDRSDATSKIVVVIPPSLIDDSDDDAAQDAADIIKDGNAAAIDALEKSVSEGTAPALPNTEQSETGG